MRALALALLAGLGGCTLGPAYRPPDLPAIAPGVVADAAGSVPVSPDAPPDAWWRLYRDPRLDALIATAFARNTDLRVAEANMRAAAALLASARAAQLPSTDVSAGASYGRTVLGDAIYAAAGGRAPDGWLDSLGFAASWQVDWAGQLRRGVEAARGDAGVAEAARDLVRVSLAASVTAAFVDVCALGRSIAVATRSADEARRALDATRRRADAGIDTRFDVARAEALAAATEAGIAPLRGQRALDLAVLAGLLAQTPDQAPADVAACTAAPQLAAPLPLGDGTALIRRRPDVRAAERGAAAASARIGVAMAALYPQVRLGGSVALNAASLGDFDRHAALSWGLGPLISWSFPDMAAARARIAAARAADAAAIARFDGAVIAALVDARGALAVYAAEHDRHAALVAADAASARALAMAADRFRDGASTYLDLLSAEQTAIAAEAALAASDRQLVLDQVALFRALGGGWQQTVSAQGE